MPHIEVTDIAKSFERDGRTRQVLRRVSLSVELGEFVSIVGAMGSGKSTLLGMMAGLVTPDAGTVTVGGVPVTGVVAGAAFVFQNYSLLPWLSARENVRLAVATAFPGETKAQHLARADAALARVGLGAALDRKPRRLSGGMRQRVAFLRTLLAGRSLLCLDEPFGALDALTRGQMQRWLADALLQEPRTVLLVTHDVEEAALLADRIVLLSPRPGRVVETIEVDLPRPRARTDLAIVELRERALAAIEQRELA